MLMIGHQTIRDHCHAKLLLVILDSLQKVLVIAGIVENLSLPGAAIVDVIILSLRESVTTMWHGISINHCQSSRPVPKAGPCEYFPCESSRRLAFANAKISCYNLRDVFPCQPSRRLALANVSISCYNLRDVLPYMAGVMLLTWQKMINATSMSNGIYCMMNKEARSRHGNPGRDPVDALHQMAGKHEVETIRLRGGPA